MKQLDLFYDYLDPILHREANEKQQKAMEQSLVLGSSMAGAVSGLLDLIGLPTLHA